MIMRWAVYAGVSVTLAAGVVLKALHQRANFYAASVYLAQSSANLMILTNFIFLLACALMIVLQRLLYGTLRPIEIEQLYEKAWFTVTETCLAMTVFRGEVGGWFLVMLFSLLAGKVWGWIGEGRVEILEQQPPANPRLFHTRLAISLSISVLFDSYVLEYCIRQVLQQAKPDMTVMFGFEFAILTILSTSTAARYAICLTEIYIIRKQRVARIEQILQERREVAQRTASETTDSSEGGAAGGTVVASPEPIEENIDEADLEVEGWEDKGRWIFYLDLATDFFKLVVYLSFFIFLLVFSALPIHIMRDVFLTCRSFFKRISDFVRYRNATRDMNQKYPDATAEEIRREDVCIICREEMRPLPQANDANATPGQRPVNPVAERMRPKKLPCGHILHFSCLRSWLERQQICPTCRRPVLPTHRTRGGVGGAPQLVHEPAEQVNAGAQAQPQADQAQPPNNQPAEGQNRARIINFGPLRIGFGAGRGDMFQDLAQQIRDGEARPPAAQPGQAEGPQRYGFGFGIGRPRPTPAPAPRAETASIQSQLSQIEQQLQQQIESLRASANELAVARMLNNELVRLRELQMNPSGQGHGAQAVQAGGAVTTSSASLPSVTAPQGLVTNTQQSLLTADSDGLPEGLTLPAGWTMMPLQRFGGEQRRAVTVSPNTGGSGTAQTAPMQMSDLGPALIPENMAPGVVPSQTYNQPESEINGAALDPGPPINTVEFSGLAPSEAAVGSSAVSNGDVHVPPTESAEQNESQLEQGAHPETTVDSALSIHEPMQPTSPTLPSWGSNPSSILSNAPPLENGEASASSSRPREKGTAAITSSENDNVVAEEPQGKGKSKAATVEDFIEDVD